MKSFFCNFIVVFNFFFFLVETVGIMSNFAISNEVRLRTLFSEGA